VKLIVRERETEALRRHLAVAVELVTSSIAFVEVSRAADVAGAPASSVDALFERCELIDVTRSLIADAARLASARLRTLDALHLASALLAAPDELIAYDARLVAAAAEAGLTVVRPA
jgi:predicted nucleic acid-binding protein